eukprot:scaffold319_cov244-Pinguiococcus_pyrenoidosus.AAC.11
MQARDADASCHSAANLSQGLLRAFGVFVASSLIEDPLQQVVHALAPRELLPPIAAGAPRPTAGQGPHHVRVELLGPLRYRHVQALVNTAIRPVDQRLHELTIGVDVPDGEQNAEGHQDVRDDHPVRHGHGRDEKEEHAHEDARAQVDEVLRQDDGEQHEDPGALELGIELVKKDGPADRLADVFLLLVVDVPDGIQDRVDLQVGLLLVLEGLEHEAELVVQHEGEEEDGVDDGGPEHEVVRQVNRLEVTVLGGARQIPPQDGLRVVIRVVHPLPHQVDPKRIDSDQHGQHQPRQPPDARRPNRLVSQALA